MFKPVSPKPDSPKPEYGPKPDIVSRAHIGSMEEYQRLYDQSIEDPDRFWDHQASLLTFFHPYDEVVEENFAAAELAWFTGGKLNVAYNCVDRHLPDKAKQTAIIWVGDEPGTYRHISFRELHENVGRMANVLRHNGVKRGDRVCLYLPMIPELAYSMLACARIGAIHSVVFAGFSADSLRDRIVE